MDSLIEMLSGIHGHIELILLGVVVGAQTGDGLYGIKDHES